MESRDLNETLIRENRSLADSAEMGKTLLLLRVPHEHWAARPDHTMIVPFEHRDREISVEQQVAAYDELDLTRPGLAVFGTVEESDPAVNAACALVKLAHKKGIRGVCVSADVDYKDVRYISKTPKVFVHYGLCGESTYADTRNVRYWLGKYPYSLHLVPVGGCLDPIEFSTSTLNKRPTYALQFHYVESSSLY